jgi:hypothetical protein
MKYINVLRILSIPRLVAINPREDILESREDILEPRYLFFHFSISLQAKFFN